MSNIRLYIESPILHLVEIPLNKPNLNYLLNVMRIKDEETIKAFNIFSGEWICKVKIKNKNLATLLPTKQISTSQNKANVILAFSLLKRQNNHLVIQKATELNVKEIYPIITDRTIVKNTNLNKLSLVAKEAAEQCGRLDIPIIHNILNLDILLKEVNMKNFVVCNKNQHSINILDLNKKIDYTQDTLVLIGPEGGFSTNDISLLKNTNATFVNLGNYTLRAETAIITSIFSIQNLYNYQ
ncbi:RsmE family RNA methyltransferase [Rickettsiales endosymbiont of Trichoplax sp. H2]|uniref:RsmE family RNA methyltransferase n=1 Tax=Rickettsiales endosymbiont of Trichoplax sp. H2 TaxID=2021221 RepID=UPI0012B410A6|nr:RsmE family RNA methyltransferase [Rickettsiales endosymbiont of Trichoplax sp. H2]MSO13899.1 Ribosomal RNA small subunit methyltransferase E [Rickettsiales endosymbiont of Trichoplax sp. H2]